MQSFKSFHLESFKLYTRILPKKLIPTFVVKFSNSTWKQVNLNRYSAKMFYNIYETRLGSTRYIGWSFLTVPFIFKGQQNQRKSDSLTCNQMLFFLCISRTRIRCPSNKLLAKAFKALTQPTYNGIN
jgi:archaellum biogenesis protein FlaJ (TadC family)